MGIGTSNEIGIPVPASASYGVDTFARFRFHTAAGPVSVDGLAADGEVEDYAISSVEADFGDAPSGYPTLRADGGAGHLLRGGLYLGAARDGEGDGQPSAAADLDDATGVDDEDGVAFNTALIAGSVAQITVTASAAGVLQGWIDFNADGDWDDPGEQVIVNEAVAAGGNNFSVWIPAAAVTGGTTYARFRVSTDSDLAAGGVAADGEVEDYAVTIDPVDLLYKWEQAPESGVIDYAYYGWNEPSIYGDGPTAADDWVCITDDPITSVTWWGSFMGWNQTVLPPVRPNGFYMGIWTDVQAGVDETFSHPGELIWEAAGMDHDVEWVGWDYDPVTGAYESCFRFEATLPESQWFYQDPGDGVYWLSIAAVYFNPVPAESFGWKTRPRDPASTAPDAAVSISDPTATMLGSTFVSGSPLEYPAGTQWDLAFELDSQSPADNWWEQLPDMSTGLDVLDGPGTDTRDWHETLIADDFQLDTTGPITDITIYGTYLEDNRVGEPLLFDLVIYEDIPAAQSPTGYSMPGDPVWSAYELATSEVPYALATEAFYDPDRTLIRGQETEIWQYYFNIDPATAFAATSGETYWLGVHHSMDLDDDGDVDIDDFVTLKANDWAFAWKTTADGWNDAATWTSVGTFGSFPYTGLDPLPTGPWGDLTYPSGHPRANDPIDMAFSLGINQQTKWQQAPDLSDDGIGVLAGPSYQARVNYETFLADEFVAANDTPIIQIDLWGSDLNDTAGPPSKYNLAIYEYIPAAASPTGYAIPGSLLWSAYQAPDSVAVYGIAPNDEFYNPIRNKMDGVDSVVQQRTFTFDESAAFRPAAGQQYWLGVHHTLDIDDSGVADAFDFDMIKSMGWAYGWHTADTISGDTAVWANVDSIGTTGEYHPEPAEWSQLIDPRVDLGVDLSFSLTQAGDRYAKWSQPPEPYVPTDAFEGYDELSVYGGGQIVAADWVCSTAAPVTDVHWWGSFLDWSDSAPAQTPDAFHLAIWSDVPVGGGQTYSRPGTVVWEALADTYTMQFVGWDNTPLDLGAAPEAVFHFEHDLPEAEWFWQEGDETVYWITIAAVYDTPPTANPWGWLAVPWDPASAAPGAGMDIWDPTAPTIDSVFLDGEPIHDPTTGDTWDMAFALTTRADADRDFGDAADPKFPTLLASDGTRHTLVPGLSLGASIDPEIDGQPTVAADGDDLGGSDDEDGVTLAAPLIPGAQATMDVSVVKSLVNPAYLNVWIDFNGDGDWDDPGEHPFSDLRATDGTVFRLTYTVPAYVQSGGELAARFRLSTEPNLIPTGLAPNGEVEDHMLPVAELDYGDAADPTYDTLLVNDGARHVLDGNLYLGAQVDGDPDGQPTSAATGDDLDGTDDEDGVFFTGWLMQGLTGTVDVIASAPGYLDAWIDFDRSGRWDQPNEAIFVATPLVTGVNSLSFQIPVTIPGDAHLTTGRFRISDTGGLATTGMAMGGEVEDYSVEIHTPGSISGWKFWDVNANGVRDGGEPGLADWVIYLDDNANGVRDGGERFTLTDPAGSYILDELAPGAYTVAEQTQTHWTQTAPAGGTYAVPITSGVSSADKNFGNWMTGDFDFDRDVDDNDIDLLGLVKQNGPYNALFDLDGDGDVDPDDLADLLTHVFVNGDINSRGVLGGDADLEGDVDLDDFVAMKNNWGTGTKWSQGDFDAEGDVDLDDFVIMKNNWGKAASAPVGVTSEMVVGQSDPAEPAPAGEDPVDSAPPRRAFRRRRRWRTPAAHYAPTVSLKTPGPIVNVLSRRRPRLAAAASGPTGSLNGEAPADILARLLPLA